MSKFLNNKVVQIISSIFKVIFTLLIIFYLVFILAQRLSGNKSVFGYRMFTVATGSMSGVYEIHDVIAVKDWDTKSLKVGDDIAYQGNRGGLEGMLITHRIIKIEEKEDGGLVFTTKGVNAPAEDPSIEEAQILGKVIGVVPIISTLNHIVKSQLGFFLCIFCPLVFIIVLEVLQTITDIQLERNEIREIEKRPQTEKKKQKKNREEIQISEHENRETKDYIDVPNIEEDKPARDTIEIL